METLQLNKDSIEQIVPSKANIELIVNDIVQDIKNGWVNPFEALAKLEGLVKISADVRKGVTEFVRAELEKYGKDGVQVLGGVKFELAEVGTKYDYSKDGLWSSINDQIEALEKKRKEREAFLKQLSKPIIETDVDTGESIESIPPTKTSTSSFKITLPK